LRAARERSGGNTWQTSSRILITTAAEEHNEEPPRARGFFFNAAASRIPVYPGQRPLFRQFYLKERAMARYVGIDLAKRTMEVCILEGNRIERHGLTNDEQGRKRLGLYPVR
jgi:hypothetical protein